MVRALASTRNETSCSVERTHTRLSVCPSPQKTYSSCQISHTPLFLGDILAKHRGIWGAQDGMEDGFFSRQYQGVSSMDFLVIPRPWDLLQTRLKHSFPQLIMNSRGTHTETMAASKKPSPQSILGQFPHLKHRNPSPGLDEGDRRQRFERRPAVFP